MSSMDRVSVHVILNQAVGAISSGTQAQKRFVQELVFGGAISSWDYFTKRLVQQLVFGSSISSGTQAQLVTTATVLSYAPCDCEGFLPAERIGRYPPASSMLDLVIVLNTRNAFCLLHNDPLFQEFQNIIRTNPCILREFPEMKNIFSS